VCLFVVLSGHAWAQSDVAAGLSPDEAGAAWTDEAWDLDDEMLAWQVGPSPEMAMEAGPEMARWGAAYGGVWSGGQGMRARGRGMSHGMRRGYGMGLRGLDLTDAQRKRIDEIVDRQMRQSIKARAELRIAQLDLRKLMRADTPDKRAIDAQIDRIGVMSSGMKKARVGVMFEVRTVLTPEQLQELKESRGNWRSGRGGPPSDRPGSGGKQ
jgi:Spy/CpxP family protein refolding chaperone